jgi:hypothetical protein
MVLANGFGLHFVRGPQGIAHFELQLRIRPRKPAPRKPRKNQEREKPRNLEKTEQEIAKKNLKNETEKKGKKRTKKRTKPRPRKIGENREIWKNRARSDSIRNTLHLAKNANANTTSQRPWTPFIAQKTLTHKNVVKL